MFPANNLLGGRLSSTVQLVHPAHLVLTLLLRLALDLVDAAKSCVCGCIWAVYRLKICRVTLMCYRVKPVTKKARELQHGSMLMSRLQVYTNPDASTESHHIQWVEIHKH